MALVVKQAGTNCGTSHPAWEKEKCFRINHILLSVYPREGVHTQK